MEWREVGQWTMVEQGRMKKFECAMAFLAINYSFLKFVERKILNVFTIWKL